MKNTFRIMSIAALAALVVTSCKKEKDAQEENDNELITTVQVKATEQGTSNTQTFTWEDIDGPGGNSAVVDNIMLAPNKVYDIEMVLLDKTKDPVENTTEEIMEENMDHRFYFTPSEGLGISFSNLDTDENGVSLGIHSTLTTTAAATGTLNIILRHYPNGNKEESDAVNSSKSSTDADVTFNVVVAAP